MILEKKKAKEASFQQEQSLLPDDVANQVSQMTVALSDKESQINNLNKMVQSLQQSITFMKLDNDKNEKSRKQLFAMVQKLKGTMRVYCRVKPLNSTV